MKVSDGIPMPDNQSAVATDANPGTNFANTIVCCAEAFEDGFSIKRAPPK